MGTLARRRVDFDSTKLDDGDRASGLARLNVVDNPVIQDVQVEDMGRKGSSPMNVHGGEQIDMQGEVDGSLPSDRRKWKAVGSCNVGNGFTAIVAYVDPGSRKRKLDCDEFMEDGFSSTKLSLADECYLSFVLMAMTAKQLFDSHEDPKLEPLGDG
ncbi:hypothetical protein GH714_017845 [Hevea brasiliensis]|uniref:Uncharacterized protein n=1 Tax=Hevea brasiliensis TaxID=3981 RepID=A0A6A6KW17_HEVBR|nr:hypothetical protein GH714_017845 [Hevea brasiliensis]